MMTMAATTNIESPIRRRFRPGRRSKRSISLCFCISLIVAFSCLGNLQFTKNLDVNSIIPNIEFETTRIPTTATIAATISMLRNSNDMNIRVSPSSKENKVVATKTPSAQQPSTLHHYDDNADTAATTPAALIHDNPSSSSVVTTTNHSSNVLLHGKVIVATYVFGKKAIDKQYLRMFVESAKTSGIDIVIVGDYQPSFQLPENVKHFQITWPELINRLHERVITVPESSPLRKELFKYNFYYKVNDYKPLFGHLFPEVVEGYEYWGHCDNDMLLGNIAKFLSPKSSSSSEQQQQSQSKVFNDEYDIIVGIDETIDASWESPLTGQKVNSWGPFTLYRNHDKTNMLFKTVPKHKLRQMLASSTQYNKFDEWDNTISISALIHTYSKQFNIKVKHGIGPVYWDGGFWMKNHWQRPETCGKCIYNRNKVDSHTGGVLSMIGSGATNNDDETEVYLCHFQASKRIIEDSLKAQNQQGGVERMIEKGEWEADCSNGYI